MSNATTPKVIFPEPKLPKNGKTSKYAGKRVYVNPKLKGKNPRQAGTHGHRVHSLILKAGAEGIAYEELKAQVTADESIVGFSNHLAWDLARGYIVIA